ncbi:CpaD family pilus assembly lipoprotein [Fodinicurvata sediminis]|uniref:CpaD family pilus assembly lipoprotein n=1 Tax=Fodinicurvata sediminis TaxID=1121832 RepID=UPI00138AAF9F|nr:CpaD family pilus assembly lipoprotein [Fodinicurvata sediminis]
MKTALPVLTLVLGIVLLGCTPRVSDPPPKMVYKNEVVSSSNEYRLTLASGQQGLDATDRWELDVIAGKLLDASEIAVFDRAAPHAREETIAHFEELGIKVAASGSLRTGDPGYPEVIVQAASYAVIPPECGDWTNPGGSGHNMASLSNLGCSNERALGLMVADPKDLASPARNPEATGSEHALGAIERYRSGELKPFPISE